MMRAFRLGKKILVLLTLVFILIGGVAINPITAEAATTTCKAKNCNNPRYEKSKYCTKHDLRYKSTHVKCYKEGCSKYTSPGHGSYCEEHDPCIKKGSYVTNKYTKKTNSSNKTTKKSTYDSYDKGYEDVYEDGDYDDERYRSDWDYALGVDDALDDLGW